MPAPFNPISLHGYPPPPPSAWRVHSWLKYEEGNGRREPFHYSSLARSNSHAQESCFTAASMISLTVLLNTVEEKNASRADL